MVVYSFHFDIYNQRNLSYNENSVLLNRNGDHANSYIRIIMLAIGRKFKHVNF
uniref:Uncharacterized protein n=1 Tax=Arundo donax TaxID=35708 RepID=A0A0A9GVR6_ARUDO